MFTFERVNNLQNVITLIEIQNNCFYCQMLSFQQVGLSLHILYAYLAFKLHLDSFILR